MHLIKASDVHILLFWSNYNDVKNRMYQYDVLWNVQMVQISLVYITKEGRKIIIAFG